MEDITVKLGFNNVDWNRLYIEYKNKGFNIDSINGRKEEPFYSVKLVSHIEEYIKTNLGPIPKGYYPIIISCFNTAREKGINKNGESFAKGVYALYTESIKKISNRNKNSNPLLNQKMVQNKQVNPIFVVYEKRINSIIDEYLEKNPDEKPTMTDEEFIILYQKYNKGKQEMLKNITSNIINIIISEMVEEKKYKSDDDVINAYKGYRDLLTS